MQSDLLALFIGSLLASTIMPGGVEVLLYYLVEQARYDGVTLLSVASLGNTLGGCVTFGMGWLLNRGFAPQLPRWLKRRSSAQLTPDVTHTARPAWPIRLWRLCLRPFQLEPRALLRVKKWGPAVLLLSWMPLLGDPLCLAAGFIRLPFWPCALSIAVGKVARYWLLLWGFEFLV